jgi:hypothetical protein
MNNSRSSVRAPPLKLGLIGFVFPEAEGVLGFHNPLSNRSLTSFWLFGNWVCFAKEWADL